jgi:hypothetical protein
VKKAELKQVVRQYKEMAQGQEGELGRLMLEAVALMERGLERSGSVKKSLEPHEGAELTELFGRIDAILAQIHPQKSDQSPDGRYIRPPRRNQFLRPRED